MRNVLKSVVLMATGAVTITAAAAHAEMPSASKDVTIVTSYDITGVVEVMGDDLLVRSPTGTHLFTGAKACAGLAASTFVNIRMKTQEVALNGGGTAQVLYGPSMASVRACEVSYKGLYTPPAQVEVTPLDS